MRTRLVRLPFVFAGGFVLPDDGGAFSVPLPAAVDVPAETLMPLADAVMNFAACTIAATPAGVQASFTVYEGVTIPGLLGLATRGSALMAATDATISRPADLAEVTAYGWIFVDRDAQLSTSGCPYVADLSLTEGWNQLAWTNDEPTISVEVVPATDVFATMSVPFPPTMAPLSPDE